MRAVARLLADAVERGGVPPSLLEVELTGLQGNCLSATRSGADALALPGAAPLTVPRHRVCLAYAGQGIVNFRRMLGKADYPTSHGKDVVVTTMYSVR
jgi:hypothetical protein